MEEHDRKRYRHNKQRDEDVLIAGAHHQQRKHAHNQDYEFSRDDVCQNRANEKSFFPFEEGAACRTVMLNVKGAFDER